MRIHLLMCFGTLLLFHATEASAQCKGVVKLIETDYGDDRVYLSVRVYASGQQTDRIVFYSVFGEVRIQLPMGADMLSSFHGSTTTLVEAGEEYAEDDIEIFVTGEPVSQPKVKQFIATDCYRQ